jgi:prephenate dehydratase
VPPPAGTDGGRLRAGYLGPPGTVSHAALLAAAPEAEAVALDTLRDVVLAVHERALPRALVPVENALEGGVDPVLDALALDAPDVALVGELVHPVSYCLAGARPLALDAVEVIVSHPQATGQCTRWLAAHAPRAGLVPAVSTADAVREVAAGPPGPRAAIGTRVAAERYGAVVLADEIEDDPGNATRFAWLAHAAEAGPPPRHGPAKTALLFWGAGSAGPGWLVACLDEFARRAINLTRIESRPLRRGLGEYMFFLDLEGSTADAEVAAAVDGLREHADLVRVLGSFPAAGSGVPAR